MTPILSPEYVASLVKLSAELYREELAKLPLCLECESPYVPRGTPPKSDYCPACREYAGLRGSDELDVAEFFRRQARAQTKRRRR